MCAVSQGLLEFFESRIPWDTQSTPHPVCWRCFCNSSSCGHTQDLAILLLPQPKMVVHTPLLDDYVTKPDYFLVLLGERGALDSFTFPPAAELDQLTKTPE